MKAAGLLFAFLVMSSLALGQKRVNILGTKVWIVPPKDAKTSKNFPGFLLGKNMIMIRELAGINYYDQEKGISREGYATLNIKVLSLQKMKFNGYPAKFAHVQKENSTDYQLFFGDSTFCVAVTATYPLFDDKVGELMKKSVLSTVYKKDQKIDPFSQADFQLNDTNTRLKFKKFTANTFMYEFKPKGHQASLMVLPLPNVVPSTLKEVVQMGLIEMSKQGLVLTKLISSKAVKVNGYEAYEMVAKARIEDKNNAHAIAVAVQKGKNLVLLQGVQSEGDFDKTVFTELINTFRFK